MATLWLFGHLFRIRGVSRHYSNSGRGDGGEHGSGLFPFGWGEAWRGLRIVKDRRILQNLAAQRVMRSDAAMLSFPMSSVSVAGMPG